MVLDGRASSAGRSSRACAGALRRFEVPTALYPASQTKGHHKAAGLGVTLDAGSSSSRHRPARRWAPARPVLRTIDDAGRLLRVFSALAGLACSASGNGITAAGFLRRLCEPLADAVDTIRVLDDFVVYNATGAFDTVIE